MNCKFESVSCSTECPKYTICMYAAIQNQLSEIQMQLNFILTTLTTLSYEEGITKERVNILEANTKDIVSTLIDLTNDSETTHEKIKQESDK